MPTIPVTTASAAYPVHIGSGLLTSLAKHLPHSGKIFVVTSPEIWSLWHEKFLASFQKQSLDPTVLFLPSGESNKRLRSIESLANQLVRAGAARDSLLIAFGGGVVGDLTGFLAAIYMRGIPYIQVPTTLLAQVDSSIGGKTGANLAAGKNLIGSFHHPLAVFADTAVLSTLPDRELRAGLFESLKAGIIYDARLFAFMESNRDAILDREPRAIERVVSASIRVKADVVGKDERESGLRMILNFGHTTGHAIEAALNYKHLLHGEAVAHGMIAATRLAANRHALPAKTAARIEQAILAYGPLPSLNLNSARLVALTASDKKNTTATRRFVLPTAIGKTSVVTDVTTSELTAAIDEMLALAAPPPQPQLKSRNPASRQAKSGKSAPINPYAELPTSGRSR